jgi:hypothetical protein
MGNSFVFPAPKSTYEASKYDPTLITIPTMVENNKCHTFACYARKTEVNIPCRYILTKTQKSPYLIIFFHGNSEDIGPKLSQFLSIFAERFSMNVLCPEYPTYGIYKNRNTAVSMEEALIEDATKVIKYAHQELKYPYENIILVGRSLGTGIAIRMGTEFKLRGVIVVSAYTGIRDVAKKLVGKVLAKVVPNILRSIDIVDQLKCPILYIHGARDTLILPEMSKKLYEKTTTPKELKICPNMTHNEFKYEPDFFSPIEEFMLNKLSLAQYILNLASCETYPLESLITKGVSQYLVDQLEDESDSPKQRSSKHLSTVFKEDMKTESNL